MKRYSNHTYDKFGRHISENPAFWANCGPHDIVWYVLKRGYMECGHSTMDGCRCDKDLYAPQEELDYMMLLVA